MGRAIDHNGLYHVLSRGVDKRKIFLDDSDRLRFLHDIFEFNDVNPPANNGRFFQRNVIARADFEIGARGRRQRDPRKLLVRVHAFCLMPNHYHLMLSAIIEGGIPLFMKKLNMGYARHFNEKYERTGALFEGRFKSVAVTNQAHLLHLPHYIHLNPLDLAVPGWREREIYDYKKAMRFLEKYRWSSYLDYIGKKNFPSITQREFLTNLVGGPKEYRNEILKWLREIDRGHLDGSCLEWETGKVQEPTKQQRSVLR